MSDTFIKKHREHAEAKKLGRRECHYEMDDKGRFKTTYTRADAAKRPPMNPIEMVPVGVDRAVMNAKKKHRGA